MNHFKTDRGEVRLVPTTVHDRTVTYSTIPEGELRARRIASEAGLWLAFATEQSRMQPDVLRDKALSSACFAVAVGAAAFVVPSKLSGVLEYQSDLWALVRAGYSHYTELGFDTATSEGVRVTLDDEAIGCVQAKHIPWIRLLVNFGLRVFLSRVSGTETRGYRLGVNVIYAGVGRAITARTEALGNEVPSGDGVSGDGASGMAGTIFPVPALAALGTTRTPYGDGASGGDDGASVRLGASPLGASPPPDPADVMLFRDIRGQACASVPHVVRHSPTGIGWGTGSGAAGRADLALSVLRRVVGAGVAERHAAAFADEVLARVPSAGGLIRVADVRAWMANQD